MTAPDPYTADSFTAACAAAVRRRRPDVAVEVQGPLQLRLTHPATGEQALSLDDLWAQVRLGLDPEGAIHDYLRVVLPDHPPQVPEGPALHAALRPVIKPLEAVRGLFDQLGSDQVPAFSFVGDLYILLVADLGDAMAVVTHAQLKRAGLAPSEALHVALQRLAESLDAVEIHGGQVRMVQAGGNYEASLLLLSSLWRQLAEALSGPLVAVPLARDLLVFIDGADPEAEAALRALIERTRAAGLSYAISETPLRWTGSGWALLDPAEDPEDPEAP